ncbi:MAG: NAD(P)H-dependent oxidoreductase subunit E [Planctomycetes bacterium]|nr:NAD(P)H-dependent oxidoreductase subunit E [Planctomycetota bacterium]
MTDPSIDLSFVDEIVARLGRGPEATIPILQALQDHYRYLPMEALRRVGETTDIPAAQLAGVSTFYDQFRLRPVGEHMIRVCVGTACHVKGAERVHDAYREHLTIGPGEDTDPARRFTVAKVACLGCCTLAPVVQIDRVIYGHVTAESASRSVEDFLRLEGRGAGGSERARLADGDGRAEIRIGGNSCCKALGSDGVYAALERAVIRHDVRAVVKQVGCVGMCYNDPLVEVRVPGKLPALYGQVRAEDAEAIVLRHFRPRGVVRRLRIAVSRALDGILTDESWEPVTRHAIEVRDPPVRAFLDSQRHIATEHCGDVDPADLDAYLARGGFRALEAVLKERTPEDVIREIEASGLRGRGGGGFPTGTKWRQVREAPGDRRYIVCNGDEGDPGAFMDRMILESYPFRIIEGMAIAAYAIGAREGILYVRHEYPLAIHRVRHALEAAEASGYLGDLVRGSPFSLHLRIMEGAGAFVCGEETALLASIEGRRGMPRYRPPYPARQGLWMLPTLVNNVETYAAVPWIIRNGPPAFAALGTETSKGTKVFALAGKVARGGMIEVPMGITIRRVVEEIGGGIAGGKKFKAVQIGGPSGGCIPEPLSDTPVDFDSLTSLGAMMGSGGFVVLDETDCMVDITRYFLEFTQNQSCGKCTFCRIGTRRMLEILERLCGGLGRKGDIEELMRLGAMVNKGSLCGLGKTAPNPVLSTIRYFRSEYEAHIEGRCPAGRCKALISYAIDESCIGCTLCAQRCPVGAIAAAPYERHRIDDALCTRCGTCKDICPVGAVSVVPRAEDGNDAKDAAGGMGACRA